MKKSALFGIVAMGMAVAGVPAAFATPTLTVTVVGTPGSDTPAFTNLSVYLGPGSYGVGPGTWGGFSWNSILTHVSATQFTVDLSSVTNGNSGNSNGTITFAISDSGISGTNILSAQASGGTTATDASSTQTVDLNSSVYSSSMAILASQDSGAIGLNSVVPILPSSSVVYNSHGVNLSSSSSTLTVTNTFTLAMNPTTTLTAGSLTNNLNSSSVPTPEPATLALFAVGGLALLAGSRRRHNRA